MVVQRRIPGSVEAVGQLCFETDLEHEWHHARGDHDLRFEKWSARGSQRQVGLDFVPRGGGSSRKLRYKTDPGLPRPFNDVGTVMVTESQNLQQLTSDGSWVVTSLATFDGLPKSDCLRVHTRYSFSAVPAPSRLAGVETEVQVSVGAEWVAGVGMPWLLQRLLERKILQDGKAALADWERRLVLAAASEQDATQRLFRAVPQEAPEPEPEPEPEQTEDEDLDFSQWTSHELLAEEQRILAELAELDANHLEAAAAAPNAGVEAREPPPDDRQRALHQAATVLGLQDDDDGFDNSSGGGGGGGGGGTVAARRLHQQQQQQQHQQQQLGDDKVVANWFDELPMVGLVLALWLGLGVISFLTVYMSEP